MPKTVAWLEVGEAPKWDVLFSVGDEDFGVGGKAVAVEHVDQVVSGESRHARRAR